MVLGHGRAWVGLAAAMLVACADDGGIIETDGGLGTDGVTTDDAASGDPSDTSGTVPSDWGPETEYELRLGEDDVPPLTLSMSRDEVAELFGERAEEVLLLRLDSTALLENTLEEVKLACGIAWQLDNENPNHDCGSTALGQSFEGPDGTWRTSPEYAMVRILTMTPANVDVSGTSSDSLASLADALGVGGGYSEILSDALGIPRTQEIVSTSSLVHAFQNGFVGSHPAVAEDGSIEIRLSDALADLATMSQTLGPAAPHPGLVDPDFEVQGEVFGPNFAMNAVAESNLRLVDGIDADGGKGFLTVVEDQTGPTYDDELEFDFGDPDRFSLEGIISELDVDMRFAIPEADERLESRPLDARVQRRSRRVRGVPGTHVLGVVLVRDRQRRARAERQPAGVDRVLGAAEHRQPAGRPVRVGDDPRGRTGCAAQHTVHDLLRGGR
jgi:hypothetical protein